MQSVLLKFMLNKSTKNLNVTDDLSGFKILQKITFKYVVTDTHMFLINYYLFFYGDSQSHR